MNFIKKYIGYSLVMAVCMVGMRASAVTMTDFQSQLSALLADMTATRKIVSPEGENCLFSRNLYQGLRGGDVSCLQGFLVKQGFSKIAPTGFFGELTKNAVSEWQRAKSLPRSGYFGSLSRGVYSKEISPKSTSTVLDAPPIVIDVPEGLLYAVYSTSSKNTVISYNPFGVKVVAKSPNPITFVGSGRAFNQLIGVFTVTPPEKEQMQISSLTFVFNQSNDPGIALQNLSVYVGGVQFGLTQSGLLSRDSITFKSSEPVTISLETSIGLYSDISSATLSGNHPAVITMTGWSATSSKRGVKIPLPGIIKGQDILIVGTVAEAPAQTSPPEEKWNPAPPITSAIMGSTNNEVLSIRLGNGSGKDVILKNITIHDGITGNGSLQRASFENFRLYSSGAQIAGPESMYIENSMKGYLTFTIPGSGLFIPHNGNKYLSVVADVPSVSSGGAVSESVHTFRIEGSDLKFVEVNGSYVPPIDTNAVGEPITIHRTEKSIFSEPIGPVSNRVRTIVDDVAKFSLRVGKTGEIDLSTVRLTLSGSALNGAPGFNVDLIDADTNNRIGSATTKFCSPASSSCTVNFTPVYTISGDSTKSMNVRIDSSGLSNANGSSDVLSIQIVAPTDLTWSDGIKNNIPVDSAIVPFTIATVSYE